jgi:predicted metallo-beta-lactamase superfamily hydrolase
MKIVPLAADSLGVRSMATYVEAGSLALLVDPGATLAPSRYNLPPSDAEWEALRRANDRISAYARRANTVFVSHYHDDHFRSDPVTYAGRRVIAKDPNRMVAGLQSRRAAALWRAVAPVARLESGDSTRHKDDGIELRISPPLPHGLEGGPMGYVIALTIVDPAERQRFVFASDVQGPLSPVAAAYLAQERPTVLYLSGPPSYIEHEVGAGTIDRGIDNLLRLMDRTDCRVIMDHHAVRDPHFETRFARLWDTGRVVTAARFIGEPENALERARHGAWAAATRKPPARTGAAGPRAIITRAPRKSAKGGSRE